jgi:hypothetical protein
MVNVLTSDIGAQTHDEPRYAEFLRPVGAYLDKLLARHVTFCETEEGFVWHCFPHGDVTRPASGMITHGELPRILEQFKSLRHARRGIFGRWQPARNSKRSTSRGDSVCPEGYEEAFRCLGTHLDRAKAMSVLIVELQDKLLVSYRFPVPGFLRRDAHRLEFMSTQHEDHYSRQQIADLIKAARGKRNSLYYS